MSTNRELQALLAQQQSYLERAIALLEGDERVVAAWLYGSLGRGASDEWSDIDLWVVVADEHIAEVRATRHGYARQLGEPLLVVDAEQNAPQDGAFLSVLYPGEVASQHVDWTWQAQSAARVPPDSKVLFNRAEIPQAAPPTVQSSEERIEAARKQATFFWMMVPVAAKYIARHQPWAALSILNLLRYVVDEVSWLADVTVEPPVYTSKSSGPPPAQPLAQMAMLHDLIAQMERLMNGVPSLHDILAAQAKEQIGRHVQLASETLK